jgi:Spy/CpxP family protein refolding chaperone
MVRMKLLIPAALAAVLSLPLAAGAQQSDQPVAQPQAGAPAPKTNAHIYRRWSRLLSGMNLTNQQHDQIQNLLDQYAQAHPAGSAPDHQGMHALRQQIFSILTPDQQTQLRQQIHSMQVQEAQRHLQQLQRQNPSQANPQPQPTA